VPAGRRRGTQGGSGGCGGAHGVHGGGAAAQAAGEARWRRSGAARWPVGAGGPDAHGGVALDRVSAAHDGGGNRRAGRRRHGRVPAVPAQEEEGSGVGKYESGVRKLTAGSI